MSSQGHIEQEDLMLFAMQLLPADETAIIAAHLAECGGCRQEAASIQGDLAIYAQTAEMHSPPAMARERLMKQVARERKVAPVTHVSTPAAVAEEVSYRPSGSLLGVSDSSYGDREEELERPRRGLAAWVFPWAGWAVAAAMAITAVNFYRQRNELRTTVAGQAGQLSRLSEEAAAARQVMDILNDPAATRVTVQAPLSKPVPQGRATYLSEKGQLIFIANNLEPLQSNKVYELWLIPADGRAPMPAGTFTPDVHGNAEVILPPLPKGVSAKMFGVTVENKGGATIPTMPILLAGTPS